MDPTRRPGIARLLALASCLVAPAASSEELVYGQPYGCNGDRFVVAYCRGDSDTGAYVTHPLDNRCAVTYIDRPRRNGFLPETGEVRGDILKKIVACGEGAAAVAPAATAAARTAAKPPAGASTGTAGASIEVPGTGDSRISLVRLPKSSSSSIIHYVDEMPRASSANAGVIEIWELRIYPAGGITMGKPGEVAQWVRFQVDCNKRVFGMDVLISLDRQAKPLGATSLDVRNEPVKAGTVGDAVAGIACKTAATRGGPRFTSTQVAIADGFTPATAVATTPAATSAPAPTNPKDTTDPGTGGSKVALLHLVTNSMTVNYVDELSRKPTANADVVVIWALSVYPQGIAKPLWPGETARWGEYQHDCRKGTFAVSAMVGLDREAKSLGATRFKNLDHQQVSAGSLSAALAGIACGTGTARTGPRLTSTRAAIDDAMSPGSASAPVTASPTLAPANPKDVEARAGALIDAWTAAYVRKDYDAALVSLREYSKLYPEDSNGYLWAGQTYKAKGDDAGAERAYLQAQRLAPQDPAVNLEVGKLFLDVHEDKVRARTEALKVLAMKSAKADQLIPAGELLWRAEDDKSAREAFRRGVQLPGEPPMLARGWVGFGRSQWKEGKYPQAIAALNEAMRLDPKNVDAHYALSGVYEDQGNPAGVLAEREAIARMEPADAWAHYSLGNAYAAMKQVAPAAAAYDKVLEMAQKDSHAQDLLSLLSDSYKEVGRPDRAITALRTALAVPNDGTLEGIESRIMRDFFHCGKLSWLLVGQKQYPEVVRMNFARGPCNGIIVEGTLGIAYVALNQPQKAIPDLEEALDGFEKPIEESQRKLSDPKLTKDDRKFHIERLAELKSESSQKLYALGRAYLLTGRKADAQRTAKTLQRYDAQLASKLTAEIASAP